jgi:hypothetical protein
MLRKDVMNGGVPSGFIHIQPASASQFQYVLPLKPAARRGTPVDARAFPRPGRIIPLPPALHPRKTVIIIHLKTDP